MGNLLRADIELIHAVCFGRKGIIRRLIQNSCLIKRKRNARLPALRQCKGSRPLRPGVSGACQRKRIIPPRLQRLCREKRPLPPSGIRRKALRPRRRTQRRQGSLREGDSAVSRGLLLRGNAPGFPPSAQVVTIPVGSIMTTMKTVISILRICFRLFMSSSFAALPPRAGRFSHNS